MQSFAQGKSLWEGGRTLRGKPRSLAHYVTAFGILRLWPALATYQPYTPRSMQSRSQHGHSAHHPAKGTREEVLQGGLYLTSGASQLDSPAGEILLQSLPATPSPGSVWFQERRESGKDIKRKEKAAHHRAECVSCQHSHCSGASGRWGEAGERVPSAWTESREISVWLEPASG